MRGRGGRQGGREGGREGRQAGKFPRASTAIFLARKASLHSFLQTHAATC